MLVDLLACLQILYTCNVYIYIYVHVYWDISFDELHRVHRESANGLVQAHRTLHSASMWKMRAGDLDVWGVVREKNQQMQPAKK